MKLETAAVSEGAGQPDHQSEDKLKEYEDKLNKASLELQDKLKAKESEYEEKLKFVKDEHEKSLATCWHVKQRCFCAKKDCDKQDYNSDICLNFEGF